MTNIIIFRSISFENFLSNVEKVIFDEYGFFFQRCSRFSVKLCLQFIFL